MLLAASAGCSQSRHRYKHPRLATENDVAGYLRIALDDELPDERRRAINQVAQTRHVGHDTVVDALDTVARTDASPAVRCAAVSALRNSGNPRAFSVFLPLIDPAAPPDGAGAVPPEVRRDAVGGLAALLEAGLDPGDHAPAIARQCIQLVARDRSRDVRLACACVLGHIQDRTVLEPLIAALDERDFGVVFEAERSLIRLTGQTFHHDAVAWRQWLIQTDDPFANAGQLDHLLGHEQKGWWQRSMDSVARTIGSFRPKKEES